MARPSVPHNRMPQEWEESVISPDALATEAPLADKTALVCHVGLVLLSGGTGGWQVRNAMNQIARLLGIRCHVDVSLLGLECSCVEDAEHCTQVVTLHTSGVNTHRIWMLEQFVNQVTTEGTDLTVIEFHRELSRIEATKPLYTCAMQGLAAGLACAAFVFLLGGDVEEMLCAGIGAGVGNYIRNKMLRRGLNQMFSSALSVAAACLCYFAAVSVLEALLGVPAQNEAGYIGAMLFVIPGFPLVTSGLDIAKLDMRSGFERFGYAFTVIVVATLAGWMVASVVGLAPGALVPLDLTPTQYLCLRLLMTFIGVYFFSVMFNSPARMCAVAGCVGAVGNTLRLELIDLAGMAPELAAFLGALASGLLVFVAIRYARALHIPCFPRTCITVPSIVIMVPGLYMYHAVYALAVFDMTTALDWGLRALIITAFLPIGLAFARILTDPRWRYCT